MTTLDVELPDPQHRAIRLRWWTGLALFLAVLLLGLRGSEAVSGEHGFHAVDLLGWNVFAALWVLTDARATGRRPTHMGMMAILFATGSGVLVYCFWSRGLRSGAILFLKPLAAWTLASLPGAALTLAAR